MSRSLTGAVQAEIAKQAVREAAFAKLAFDSGDMNVWSGVGTRSWNGEDWIGVGSLGQLSPIEETSEIRATGLQLELSAVPSDQIAVALAEPYQGRPATVWVGFVDDADALIADPVQLFAGRMDTMEIDDGAEAARIQIACENRLIDLERPRERRYTDQDQQAEYPGDVGFEYVPSLQDKELVWGAQSPPGL